MHAATKKILRRLGLTPDQLTTLQQDMGQQAAQCYWCHPSVADTAPRNSWYWSWYLNEWERIDSEEESDIWTDAQGVPHYHSQPIENPEELYRLLHEPDMGPGPDPITRVKVEMQWQSETEQIITR